LIGVDLNGSCCYHPPDAASHQPTTFGFQNLTSLLQNNNIVALSGITNCEYLELAVELWLNMAVVPQPPSAFKSIDFAFVLWAQVLPVRE
jgi:hypothetical protein